MKLFFQQQNCQGNSFTFTDRSYICFANNGYNALVNSIKSIIVDEQTPPAGCVWLYDDNCLSGNRLQVCVSDLNDPKWNFGNKTSSFKLGSGVSGMIVYLGRNYEGSSSTVKGDKYELHGTWLNKDNKSLKILRF